MTKDDFILGYQDGQQDKNETDHGIGAREQYQIVHGHLPNEDKPYWNGYQKGWLEIPNLQTAPVTKTHDGQKIITSCTIKGKYNNDMGQPVFVKLVSGTEGEVYLAQERGAMVNFPSLEQYGFTGIWLDNDQMLHTSRKE